MPTIKARGSKHYTSVITGDIVQSRSSESRVWLPELKKALSKEGKSPRVWQIYRGDSFQIEVADPAGAFFTSMRIKATIKAVKDLDVRMSIGIGEKKSAGGTVTESEGQAFIFSGETFETLKQSKRNLAIKTPWAEFDRDMNVCFQLASIPMDGWTEGSAELIKLLLSKPDLTQKALAKKLGITQPAVSDRQNRSHYETIMALEALYREKVIALISPK